MKLLKYLFSILFLLSCISTRKAHKLIDQRDTMYWESSRENHKYQVKITSSEGIWFKGQLIVDEIDTLFLEGFEKGNNHPTSLSKISNTDSLHLGHIFIWTRGWHADTIDIINQDDSLVFLPRSLELYKKAIFSN